MKVLKALYRFFSSTKLALFLLMFIVLVSALATLIPQGKEPSYYTENYSPFLASAILLSNYHSFFRSFLFLFPAALFFVNLAVCTAGRLVKRAKTRAPQRFGPDLIHVGILFLMIGALISLFGKREGSVFLSPGEWVELPNSYKLVLVSFKRTTYEDGRPKEFISTVDILKQNKKITSYAIEVNKPLKIGRLRVFQESFSTDSSVILQDQNENSFVVKEGSGFKSGDSIYMLQRVAQKTKPDIENEHKTDHQAAAVFGKYKDKTLIRTYTSRIFESFEGYTVQDIIVRESTGLRFVEDEGAVPVFISFMIIGLGLLLTFIQKLGDKNL